MTIMYTELAERHDRATLFFEMGRYIEAARELEPVVEAAPEHVAARLLLARAYFHSAQLGRAEAALREMIARAPVDAYAHLMLGRTLQRQNRHAEAVGPLQLAAAMDPTLAA
jgi:tetratricopeptide (TPR) repeat protein